MKRTISEMLSISAPEIDFKKIGRKSGVAVGYATVYSAAFVLQIVLASSGWAKKHVDKAEAYLYRDLHGLEEGEDSGDSRPCDEVDEKECTEGVAVPQPDITEGSSDDEISPVEDPVNLPESVVLSMQTSCSPTVLKESLEGNKVSSDNV